MSRQTYTVTTRVRIEQTFEVDAGCAQDAAEAAELYVARELTGIDMLIDEPVRLVGRMVGPVVNVSTEEKAPAEVVPLVPGRGLARSFEESVACWQAQRPDEDDYTPDGPRGSL